MPTHVRISAEFPRPSAAQLAALAALGTATLQDASGGRGVLDPRIKPLRAGMRVCGPALTCACPTLDNLAVHAALKVARPGDVIVCDAGGDPAQGMFGDLMAACAVINGVGGVVMNGGVRDAQAIVDSGLPVFARGVCVRAGGKATLGPVAVPIAIGGVVLAPGDAVVGDDDGVVVIPLAGIDQVVAAAQAKAAREAAMRAAFAQGQRTWDVQNLGDLMRKQGIEIDWQ
jgi:4-hydroxy-4-methyl-2-oxoglutarate aldolase